jgi:hypothetical protein
MVHACFSSEVTAGFNGYALAGIELVAHCLPPSIKGR